METPGGTRPAPARQAAWQLQGDAGLAALAQRLREAGSAAAGGRAGRPGLALRPYQLQGLAWLQYLRAQGLAGILADDMGLGKTAQVLAHLLVEKQAGRWTGRRWWCCPTSLMANWQAEAARIAPALRVLVLQGADRADFDASPRTTWSSPPTRCCGATSTRCSARPGTCWCWTRRRWSRTPAAAPRRAAPAEGAPPAVRHRHAAGEPPRRAVGALRLADAGLPGRRAQLRAPWRKPIETNGETLRAQLLASACGPSSCAGASRTWRPSCRQDRGDPPRAAAGRAARAVRERAPGGRRAGAQGAGSARLRRRADRVLDALLKLRQVCCDPRLVKGTLTPPDMPRAKMDAAARDAARAGGRRPARAGVLAVHRDAGADAGELPRWACRTWC
jgi:hypothetical protein